MPSFSSKVELTSAASSSGLALADIEFIRGAFYTVAEYTDLDDIPVARVSDNQIVWVEDAASCYQASVTQPDYINTFEPTVSWTEFTGFGGSGGGSGDITAVIAGNGLTGGAFSGTATLNIGAGNGITVASDAISVNPDDGISVSSSGVALDTGSAHFTNAVEYQISSGSYIIDSGGI